MPPALVAMLPPIEQEPRAAKSTGYCSPCSRAALCTASRAMPGCTVRVRSTALKSSTLFIRSRLSTSSPFAATAPPDRPVRPPEGTMATRCCVGPAHDGLHFLDGSRQRDRQRRRRPAPGPVAAVVLQVGRIGLQAQRRARLAAGRSGAGRSWASMAAWGLPACQRCCGASRSGCGSGWVQWTNGLHGQPRPRTTSHQLAHQNHLPHRSKPPPHLA